MNLPNKIQESRERALGWLDTMIISADRPEQRRFSAFHDPARWPGMLLPASYDAIHCQVLLGGWNPGSSTTAIDFLNGYQEADGAYRLPGMTKDSIYKGPDAERTREYIDFHATNYTLGAIRSLGGQKSRPLAFMEKYRSKEGLRTWMDSRLWDDPWMEGNFIVNLGSFLIDAKEGGNEWATPRLDELMDWLDCIQDDSTGFWGERFKTRREILEGMAGAMHTYHLYYHQNRGLKRLDRIAEHCLSLARNELSQVSSACLDVDIVDVLANIHRLGLRRTETEGILEQKLLQMLACQNADGGFPDERSGILRFDGWVGGYWEPQGISNCFATWFRCTTIAMIDCVLFPENTSRWCFRNTVGIGYFSNDRKA